MKINTIKMTKQQREYAIKQSNLCVGDFCEDTESGDIYVYQGDEWIKFDNDQPIYKLEISDAGESKS
jgi:hypothetical protein